MSTEDATTPVADDVVSSAPEVADEATAQGELDTDRMPDPDADPDTPEGEEGEAKPDTGADETEEVELDGAKHRIPKALKGAFLMQADYTRKTQELAQTRQAWEQERAQQTSQIEALTTEIGTVHAYEARIKEFEAIDWDRLRAANPDEWRELRDDYTDAKDKLASARQTLDKRKGELAEQRSNETAKQRQEAAQELAKIIPDWNADTARKIAEHGIKEYGITPDEIREMTDARLWRALNDTRLLRAENAALKSKQAKTAVQAKVQEVTPAAEVKGKAAPTGPTDTNSTAEWMRRRNAQVRKTA
jgi:hypothetical protein